MKHVTPFELVAIEAIQLGPLIVIAACMLCATQSALRDAHGTLVMACTWTAFACFNVTLMTAVPALLLGAGDVSMLAWPEEHKGALARIMRPSDMRERLFGFAGVMCAAGLVLSATAVTATVMDNSQRAAATALFVFGGLTTWTTFALNRERGVW